MSVVDDLLDKLATDQNDERYNGADFELAERHISADAIHGIPWCIYDFAVDDEGKYILRQPIGIFGQIKSDDLLPVRRLNIHNLVVLAWVMVKKRRPELTMEDVAQMIDDSNIVDIVDDVFIFWGQEAFVEANKKAQAEREAAMEAGEEPPEVEYADPLAASPDEQKAESASTE